MESHLARVVLVNTEDRNQEITIDLVVEGRTAKPGLDYFGLWQDKGQEVLCPFVLDPNGSVDFGNGYEGSDRYYETNIGSLELAIGLQVLWRSGDSEQTFRVTGVTQLA